MSVIVRTTHNYTTINLRDISEEVAFEDKG
jgi:hypothetical protein